MSDLRTRSRRRTIWNWAKIALALGLMAFVLSRISVNDLVDVARRASLCWLVLAALAYCASAWFLTLRYWVLIRRQIALSQLFGVVLLQNAISNLVASGLGAASYVAVLRGEHQVTAVRGVASLLLARVGTCWLCYWRLWHHPTLCGDRSALCIRLSSPSWQP